jgi:hypothetical protein
MTLLGRYLSVFAARAGLVAGASALFAGCVGDLGGVETTDEAPAAVCAEGELSPGPSPIRRLTRFEYNLTVRDLLGVRDNPANALPSEEEALGFQNNASALNVTPLLAEKYMTLAETVSRAATEDLGALTSCRASMPASERRECVRSFVADLAKRAFRRPVTEVEVDQLLGVFDAAAELYADAASPETTIFREGIAMVIEALLQSPEFLYRVELGEAVEAVTTASGQRVKPLDSWEMASRLSFFIWGSMPDDELFSAAEAGALESKEQIAIQARRMLADPKARDAVAVFHRQWLDYDRLNNVTKDAALYPDWSPAIGALMQEEMQLFIGDVLFDGPGDLGTLLTADYTYANDELANFYGKSAASDAFERIELDRDRHAGLLSMGAILSYYAHSNQSSPVHRGKLVREALLCDVLQPPPPGLIFEVPEPSPDATTRERFDQHSKDPACKGCHELMDPLGFGFENYDGVGRFRTEENGEPIDATGTVVDSDIDGPFVGVRELSEKLLSSEEVKQCYAKMWFRFAYGRGETPADECSLDATSKTFEATGGNVRELLVALTQTDAFLYRIAREGE